MLKHALQQYNNDFFTKNRKLVLNEYDDDGNLIDAREFTKDEMAMFIGIMYNTHSDVSIARAKDRNDFTDEQLKLIQRVVTGVEIENGVIVGRERVNFFSKKDVDYFKQLFKDCSTDLIEFVLYVNKRMVSYNSFQSMIELVRHKTGIFYTVDNKGTMHHIYSDTPKLRQYKYQFRKYGRRIVFLNFKDWKEYIVNESDLK